MVNELNRLQKFARENPRLLGVLVVLVGAVFVYFSIVEPILHAQIGERIKLFGKSGIGGIFFVIFGAALIAVPGVLNSMQALESQPKKLLCISLIAGVCGIVAMESLKSYLRGKGYVL